jgi:HK97 family phage portal protein
MAVQWLLTHGAAYIWSPPRQAGQRREMLCLASNRVAPLFDLTGNLVYRVAWRNGETSYLPDVEVLALLINSTDGITGNSVIGYARETLGRQLGAYETQGKFYAQGLNPGGIIYMPGDLNKEARDKIRETYGEAMGGSSNAYRLAVMDAKISKFEVITMKPVDAQFLESINATDMQIANFFGMPAYKVNMGKQSYESNEQQDLDYLKTTLDPYLVQWEQAAALRWLSEAEQNYTYFRFNRDVILRTDAKTRTGILKDKIQSGQLSPNEARQIEDMPAYPEGDARYMPANMAMIGENGELVSAGGTQSSGTEQGGTQT